VAFNNSILASIDYDFSKPRLTSVDLDRAADSPLDASIEEAMRTKKVPTKLYNFAKTLF
jgi:hypothetical protein